MREHKTFSSRSALAVVVANMIGTGVFTSLGYQVVDIQSGFVILLLWVLGGVAALCGALCYAELGAALPRSGGEYNFLSRIYHPGAGFVAGWVSAMIGFAAPIALASLAFAAYITPADNPGTTLAERLMAGGLILSMAFIHSGTRSASGGLQTLFTAFKIAVIIIFSIAALMLAPSLQPISFTPNAADFQTLNYGAFAVSLIYVGYAYTGWNAATYLTGELSDAQKELPRVLILGTSIVMVLYLLLNAVFLLVAPIDAMKGVEEVGRVAAVSAFGESVGQVVGLLLAALLISTVSAMTVAGPRVLQVMGEDIPAFKPLSRTNADGIPARSVWVQTGLALLFISIGTFEQVLVFSGFTLALVSLLAVVGAVVLRFTQPNLERPFRMPLYPLPAIGFTAIMGLTLGYLILEKPVETQFSAILIGSGIVIYAVLRLMGAERLAHLSPQAFGRRAWMVWGGCPERKRARSAYKRSAGAAARPWPE